MKLLVGSRGLRINLDSWKAQAEWKNRWKTSSR